MTPLSYREEQRLCFTHQLLLLTSSILLRFNPVYFPLTRI
jgi:hypothetical protein